MFPTEQDFETLKFKYFFIPSNCLCAYVGDGGQLRLHSLSGGGALHLFGSPVGQARQHTFCEQEPLWPGKHSSPINTKSSLSLGRYFFLNCRDTQTKQIKERQSRIKNSEADNLERIFEFHPFPICLQDKKQVQKKQLQNVACDGVKHTNWRSY